MRGHLVESGLVQANDVKSSPGAWLPSFRGTPSALAPRNNLCALSSIVFLFWVAEWLILCKSSLTLAWVLTTKSGWERHFLVFFFSFMEGTLKWRASALPEIWPALHLSGNKVRCHADWSFTSHKLHCNDNNEGTNGLTVLRWRAY